MIDLILTIYLIVALGWTVIGLSYEGDIIISLIFGLLWPLIMIIFVIRAITD